MDKRGSTRYITEQIEHICKTYKNRTGGSQAERDCQRYFQNELENWSDEVTAEEYKIHPGAFLGWIIPAGLLSLTSIAFYWARLFSQQTVFLVLSLACITASLSAFVFEFLLYRKFTDAIYPAKKSVNVMARRKPLGQVKRRIVFGGHADAAYEMTYILYRNAKSVYTVTIGSVLGMVFMVLLNIASLIMTAVGGYGLYDGVWHMMGMASLVFVPFFVAVMFSINWNKVVDGANDNLTGCLVSMSVLRNLAQNDIRLQNTEVCCLITGGEEEGLRGAMAYAKAHKHEFDDVETVFVSVDTLREISELQVYTKGMNGTQKNSEYVADLLRQAGSNCGVDLGDAGSYPGATDAEAFSREGLLACGLGGVNHIPQTYYHTRHDTYDNIDEGCIKLSLDICMETARIYDAGASENKHNIDTYAQAVNVL